MSLQAFEGGFADPVFQSQAAFRTVMDAMARPGIVRALDAAIAPPAAINAAAGAVLLTLADADTPVWLDARAAADPSLATWIAFHTGAPITEDRTTADFAVIADPAQALDLSAFALGSQEYPDRSTTLILCVDGFDGPDRLELEGPGIRGVSGFAPSRLPKHFAEQWQTNGARFPRGVDIIFAAPGAVAAMPRTASIRIAART